MGILDTDTGFLRPYLSRLDARGWTSLAYVAPPDPARLVAARLHALVLDLALAGHDPWSYLQGVCAANPALAVIVCTGRSSVADRVQGLRVGADDWLTKPCHAEELLARVEVGVRRRRTAELDVTAGPLSTGCLEISPRLYDAFADGRAAGLTRREFELLQLLAREEGKVVAREEIYRRVWGYTMAHGDRSVDVFVRKLRHKLELVAPGSRFIHTHFGVGYRFELTTG